MHDKVNFQSEDLKYQDLHKKYTVKKNFVTEKERVQKTRFGVQNKQSYPLRKSLQTTCTTIKITIHSTQEVR